MSGLKVRSNCVEQLEFQESIFVKQLGVSAVWSLELEFYVVSSASVAVLALCEEAGLQVTSEQGDGQFELSFPLFTSGRALVKAYTHAKKTLISLLEVHGASVLFDAKPFKNQPGSGLHIHVHLVDKDGKNVFASSGDDKETDMMQHAVAGLLASMPYFMPVFAPKHDSYARFVPHGDAPTHICWGGNNRTVAIRIPTSSTAPETRHLEHRVAGSDAVVEEVLLALLKGMLYGIMYRLYPDHEKIYGNAYDAHYREAPYCLEEIMV